MVNSIKEECRECLFFIPSCTPIAGTCTLKGDEPNVEAVELNFKTEEDFNSKCAFSTPVCDARKKARQGLKEILNNTAKLKLSTD